MPNASTFCGRCEEVCPVRIPLPRMMRDWREREFERHFSPAPLRYGLGFWAFFAARSALPLRHRACGARSPSRGAQQGKVRLAAARRRLDAVARSGRARADDLQSQWRARSGATK